LFWNLFTVLLGAAESVAICQGNIV
jgi:hypothetical protein